MSVSKGRLWEGEEKKNSNPFVFIIHTVLRDATMKEEEEEEEGETVKSNGLAVPPPVI